VKESGQKPQPLVIRWVAEWVQITWSGLSYDKLQVIGVQGKDQQQQDDRGDKLKMKDLQNVGGWS
jgi:hypothetical protein